MPDHAGNTASPQGGDREIIRPCTWQCQSSEGWSWGKILSRLMRSDHAGNTASPQGGDLYRRQIMQVILPVPKGVIIKKMSMHLTVPFTRSVPRGEICMDNWPGIWWCQSPVGWSWDLYSVSHECAIGILSHYRALVLLTKLTWMYYS